MTILAEHYAKESRRLNTVKLIGGPAHGHIVDAPEPWPAGEFIRVRHHAGDDFYIYRQSPWMPGVATFVGGETWKPRRTLWGAK